MAGWAPSYVSASELADYVRIGDTDDDAVMDTAIAAASRAVDRTCGRQFGKSELEDRLYTATYWPKAGRWVAETDDIATDEDLVVGYDRSGDGDEYQEAGNYLLRPANAPRRGRPWTEIRFPRGVNVGDEPDAVRVTARFGWSDVPEAVRQATLMQSSRLLSRRDSPFGVAGSPEEGSEVRLLAKVDPDVAVVLRDYIVRWLGV